MENIWIFEHIVGFTVTTVTLPSIQNRDKTSVERIFFFFSKQMRESPFFSAYKERKVQSASPTGFGPMWFCWLHWARGPAPYIKVDGNKPAASLLRRRCRPRLSCAAASPLRLCRLLQPSSEGLIALTSTFSLLSACNPEMRLSLSPSYV
jgi:hypothetical protein